MDGQEKWEEREKVQVKEVLNFEQRDRQVQWESILSHNVNISLGSGVSMSNLF